MTVIYLMAHILRRKLSLNQRLLMVSAFNLNDMNDVGRVVVDALKLTFTLEGVGAAVLAACFAPRYGWWGIWKGVFIAVSAYCNAGFDLLGPEGLGSLSSYNGHPIVLLTVMALVTCGGLGFFVWGEIREKRAFRPLSLYSKMVIWLTGGLLVFGWVFFLCAEWSNPETLGAMPVWKRVLNALFQSVTLRTAGFAAISQGGLTEVSQVMSILLMLVGGSSGSTAGGLKTVTVGVLLLALKSCLRGRDEVTFRERTIPQRKVLAALTLVLVVGAVFIVSSMAIAIVDGVPYLAAAFEAASAIATVGLTTGITAGLSPLSHLMLIFMMYLGRVGILSFSLAFLTQSGGANKIGYPETRVMIG
jgi:trk system potassium uptake protein TrkH